MVGICTFQACRLARMFLMSYSRKKEKELGKVRNHGR
jgi:hypothetical protein